VTGKVAFDMSISLDGFIAGPNDNAEQALGKGGERLHEWVYELASFKERHGRAGGERNRDDEVLEEAFGNVGATVMGRRMFDLGEKPWGDDPPFRVPVFVVTHHGRDTLQKEGGTSFTFVTDGIESVLEQARAAAGDKDISVAGGANVIQQCLEAGLIDEFQIHVAPLLLGAGRRLFDYPDADQIELESIRVIDSPGVTHLKFRVVK
jgi:dihydrofolate reductase